MENKISHDRHVVDTLAAILSIHNDDTFIDIVLNGCFQCGQEMSSV